MKKFLAIYTGSPTSPNAAKWNAMDSDAQKKQQGLGGHAWMKWGEVNSKSIVDPGSPIGKTKQIDANGISDIKNKITAFTIVEAESHEAAAKLFLNHPHFTIFPGDAVEVMEFLPIPKF